MSDSQEMLRRIAEDEAAQRTHDRLEVIEKTPPILKT